MRQGNNNNHRKYKMQAASHKEEKSRAYKPLLKSRRIRRKKGMKYGKVKRRVMKDRHKLKRVLNRTVVVSDQRLE